ncbi:MAG: Protease HtpX [Pseudomonadota bacterium]|jgi:Zn-dependent protease with chaperone function
MAVAKPTGNRVTPDPRTHLALLFLPGLYLVLLASIGLILATAALLIVGVVKVFAWFDYAPIGIIGALILGAGSGVWAVARGLFAAVRRARTHCDAIQVSASEAPRLFALLDELARQLGAAVPKNVVLSVGPEFFVTEVDVVGIDRTYRGRTLCLSAPLLHMLTEAELRGVLAHELAHFTGHDTVFSRRFYPVYRGTAVTLTRMEASAAFGGVGAAALGPSFLLLAQYLRFFATVESRIGRSRELRADREAATLVGNDVMASALLKVHAYAPAWLDLLAALEQSLADGKRIDNTASYFAREIAPRGDRIAATLASEGTQSWAHPTDSHPPLGERLGALGFTPQRAPSLQTGDCAAALISALETKEIQLSGYFSDAFDRARLAAMRHGSRQRQAA